MLRQEKTASLPTQPKARRRGRWVSAAPDGIAHVLVRKYARHLWHTLERGAGKLGARGVREGVKRRHRVSAGLQQNAAIRNDLFHVQAVSRPRGKGLRREVWLGIGMENQRTRFYAGEPAQQPIASPPEEGVYVNRWQKTGPVYRWSEMISPWSKVRAR